MSTHQSSRSSKSASYTPVQVVTGLVAALLGVLTLYLIDKALSDLGTNQAGPAAGYLCLFTLSLVATSAVAARAFKG